MTANKINEILQRIRDNAKKRFLPIVDHFGSEKGELLEKLVKENKPKNVLEIGTLVGYSGLLIIRNLPPAGKLITIDNDSENAEIAKQNFNEAGVSDRMQLVFGDAINVIPKLKVKFDFVFIDAEKEQYLTYLKLLEEHNLLNPNAIILADNVKIFAAEVTDYLDYVHNSGKYKSSYHDFGEDGMEVSKLL